MTASDLLGWLRDRGVTFTTAGGQLEYDAPLGVMTPEVLAAVRAAKPELLDLLLVEEMATYGLAQCDYCKRILVKRHLGGDGRCTDRRDCALAWKARTDAEATTTRGETHGETHGEANRDDATARPTARTTAAQP